jgi:hypothetical protein
MAKINFGGLAQDVRGSQNGLTYSRNAGGAYVRTKVSPVQPRSPRQLIVRASFALNSKAWSGTLTAAERTAWTAFAAANPITDVFGNAITINGLAMFNKLNQVLANLGIAMILTPPASLAVPALAAGVSLAAVHTTPTLVLTTASQTVTAGATYYAFATPSLAVGINPNQSVYRYIGALPAVASATSLAFGALWAATFGTMIAGKNVWVLLATASTTSGALTPPVKFSALAT